MKLNQLDVYSVGPKLCNSLKDNIRISRDLSSFASQIYKVDLAGM